MTQFPGLAWNPARSSFCGPNIQINYSPSILVTKCVGAEFFYRSTAVKLACGQSYYRGILPLHNGWTDELSNSVHLLWINPVLTRTWLIIHTGKPHPVLMFPTRCRPTIDNIAYSMKLLLIGKDLVSKSIDICCIFAFMNNDLLFLLMWVVDITHRLLLRINGEQIALMIESLLVMFWWPKILICIGINNFIHYFVSSRQTNSSHGNRKFDRLYLLLSEEHRDVKKLYFHEILLSFLASEFSVNGTGTKEY